MSYIPLTSEGYVNTSIMYDVHNNDLGNLQNTIDQRKDETIYNLEEGSKYHGYKDENSIKSLDYNVINHQEFHKAMPVSDQFYWYSGKAMVDYFNILENDVDVCDYVDNQGVKEVWLWGYVPKTEEPASWESSMSMGTNIQDDWNYGDYGNVSNSLRQNDMPQCQKTYTAYFYNYGRETGTMIENHTHQIEAVMRHVDSNMWDGQFIGTQGPGQDYYRCGWTHYPPNVMKYLTGHDYDWYNFETASSDCEDWTPDGTGEKKIVSCQTWGGQNCPWDGGLSFKVWWMQNIPGYENNISYSGSTLKNWWDFIGDFDSAIGDKTFVN